MRNGKHQKVPARLARLERRFAYWRENRQRGERIPKPLWQAAAKLAVDHGVSITASVLGLDYYALKERRDRLNDPPVSRAPFIALPAQPRLAVLRTRPGDDYLEVRSSSSFQVAGQFS